MAGGRSILLVEDHAESRAGLAYLLEKRGEVVHQANKLPFGLAAYAFTNSTERATAVADALESGHLGGYAADVFECEDWARPGRPAAIEARLTRPGAPTVLTPHIGSAVMSVRRQIELSAAASIIEVLAGKMPDGATNVATRETAISALIR